VVHSYTTVKRVACFYRESETVKQPNISVHDLQL